MGIFLDRKRWSRETRAIEARTRRDLEAKVNAREASGTPSDDSERPWGAKGFQSHATAEKIETGVADMVAIRNLNEIDTYALRAYLNDREKEYTSGLSALDAGIAGLEAKRKNKQAALESVLAGLGKLDEVAISVERVGEAMDGLEEGIPDDDQSLIDADQSSIKVNLAALPLGDKSRRHSLTDDEVRALHKAYTDYTNVVPDTPPDEPPEATERGGPTS